MSIAYTDIVSVFDDTNLYIAFTKGSVLNMSMFPAITKNRFNWFVDNWTTLYQSFKQYANGDENLESVLIDFDSVIKSYKLGSKMNVFNDSQKIQLYQPFLETLSLNSIALTTAESTIVDTERQRLLNFTIENFRAMLKYSKQYESDLCGNIGLSDPYALKALGTTSTTKTNSPTLSSLEYIETIIELNKYIVSIIYQLKQQVERPPNLIAVANQNVDTTSRVRFIDGYTSANSVPFEQSLEHMAQKYMGSKDLWFTIAQINNLQPPYFDPTGIKYYLITPGANNSIIVADTEKYNLHVGAKLSIGSFKIKEEVRIVEKIIYNNNSTMVLFLSGDRDLTKLQVTHKAFARIFAPHTISNTDFVLIPSFTPATLKNSTTPNSDSLRRLDTALLNFGVDVAHDIDTGDILIGTNGNFVLSYGIKNIKQAIENLIKTTKKELPFHPSIIWD